jgi:hypothetical protein
MEISHYPFYVAMISITCTIASSKNEDLFILSRFKYWGRCRIEDDFCWLDGAFLERN